MQQAGASSRLTARRPAAASRSAAADASSSPGASASTYRALLGSGRPFEVVAEQLIAVGKAVEALPLASRRMNRKCCAILFQEAVVGRVADQLMPKPEGILAAHLGGDGLQRVPCGQAPSAAGRGLAIQPRAPRRRLDERLDPRLLRARAQPSPPDPGGRGGRPATIGWSVAQPIRRPTTPQAAPRDSWLDETTQVPPAVSRMRPVRSSVSVTVPSRCSISWSVSEGESGSSRTLGVELAARPVAGGRAGPAGRCRRTGSARRARVGHVLDQVKERRLAPVQIVEHDDERSLASRGLEQLPKGPCGLVDRGRCCGAVSRVRRDACSLTRIPSGSRYRPVSCLMTSITGQ